MDNDYTVYVLGFKSKAIAILNTHIEERGFRLCGVIVERSDDRKRVAIFCDSTEQEVSSGPTKQA